MFGEEVYMHVVPDNDIRKHIIDRGADCWCEPMIIVGTTSRLVVHSMLAEVHMGEEYK